ncbi:hypothetical protein CMV30_11945 [Nibricoccus aquaticus]|uniref:Aminotransferase class V domain-containing protein n=1 Tax=Nibricoccus aquaticus TaxID=2576891 RepID=A0A290QBP2_9BACT|nr:aminotransferase class V-fold PLP-dependent enzyme [Nibricoccus aquaticus]ATC64610.1 hypothetical protein CMV30_11945 [Nibricoccus aquaticus]
MKFTRTHFLRSLGAGAMGLLAASRLKASSSAPHVDDVLPIFDASRAEEFWKRVRALYPISEELAYFNCGGLGPSSRPVLDVYERSTRSLQLRVDSGHASFDEARRTFAKFFGTDAEELCFTRNATESNSIIAAGIALRAGDEIIFESHAHPGGSLPWLNQVKQRGAVVKTFEPATDSAASNLERLARLITTRTRVIQVSHVTAPTGVVMPVAAMAELAREKGIWFHIDGAQSAGMLPFDLHEIDCDSYATSGHKWLGGPRESGLLYIKKSRVEEIALSHLGAYSSENFDFTGKLEIVPGTRRHEYGTRNAATVLALQEAARFQESIGRQRIAERGLALATQVHRGLEAISGVQVLTPSRPELRASMTTFKVKDVSSEKLFGHLLGKHKLRCRPVTEENLDALRVSTHLFNTADECDRLVTAVAEFAKTA